VRQSLVLGVMLVHKQWAQQDSLAGVLQQVVGLQPDAAGPGARVAEAAAAAAAAAAGAGAAAARRACAAADWDPIQQQAWHPSFPLHTVTLAQVRQAAALHRQQLQQRYRLPGEQEQAVMRAARPPVSTREAPLCEAGGPLGTEAFLQHLQALPWYEGQVGAGAGPEHRLVLLRDVRRDPPPPHTHTHAHTRPHPAAGGAHARPAGP
jgi:hypothetical protein